MKALCGLDWQDLDVLGLFVKEHQEEFAEFAETFGWEDGGAFAKEVRKRIWNEMEDRLECDAANLSYVES